MMKSKEEAARTEEISKVRYDLKDVPPAELSYADFLALRECGLLLKYVARWGVRPETEVSEHEKNYQAEPEILAEAERP